MQNGIEPSRGLKPSFAQGSGVECKTIVWRASVVKTLSDKEYVFNASTLQNFDLLFIVTSIGERINTHGAAKKLFKILVATTYVGPKIVSIFIFH